MGKGGKDGQKIWDETHFFPVFGFLSHCTDYAGGSGGYLYQQSESASREKYLEREQGRLARSAAYFERYLEQLDSTVLKLAYDADLQQILKMDKPRQEKKRYADRAFL